MSKRSRRRGGPPGNSAPAHPQHLQWSGRRPVPSTEEAVAGGGRDPAGGAARYGWWPFAVAVVLVAFSRWLAFPQSIWDMDEANFALGVIRFDPVHNQPHAPFFPLWILLGKAARWLVPALEATSALQIVSSFFSVAVVVPLAWMWSAVLSRGEAWAASILYLFLPGVWLLSGRAYTEPTATALLVTALGAWMAREPSRLRLAAGGLAVIAAVLVRPQWLPVALLVTAWRTVTSRLWGDRAIALGVPAVVGGAVVAIVAGDAGGIGPLWAAVRQHRAYMAGAGEGFEWGFGDLGIHAAAGGIVPGTIWLVLAAVGWASLLRDPQARRAASVLVGLVVAPFVLVLLLTQNPTLPRYALPILALTAGAVVAGIRVITRSPRWAVTAVGAWVAGCVVVTLPVLATYRNEASPVVAAFDRLAASPDIRAVAADRRLVAFVTLEQVRGHLAQQLVWDYQVELGIVESPFRRGLAAVAAGGKPPWVSEVERISTFSCDQPLLRRVASPRFLDVTLVEGCGLVKPAEPSIRPDDLRPGSVIPAQREPSR